jgi:hypothetical protein
MNRVRAPAADAWVRNRLIAGAGVLFGVRLALSIVRLGPVVVADEIGYLTNARVLIGGVPGQLERAPFYRGGYSLLVSPLLELTSNPRVAYHLVLALNAALAASLVALLYLVLTRCAGFAPRMAVWPALAGAAYPSITVFSQAALSENALFPLVCLWLLALGGLLAARTPRAATMWGIALGACAVALWAVHGRMVTVLGLTAAVALWLVVRRRGMVGAAVAIIVVLAVGFWATQLLNDFLINHNYGGHAANEVNDRLSAVLGLHPLLTALSNLAGQAWYLLVSTFGLVIMVAADALPRRVTRSPDAAHPGRRAFLLWLLALTALLLLVSAGSFPVRTRPDMLIYGRYVEIVTPALVAIGLAILGERGVAPRMRAFAAVLGGLTLIVVLIRALASNPGVASRWNVASLPFLTFQLGPAVLIGAGLLAAGGRWLLGRSGVERRVAPGLVAVALFVPIAAYGELNPVINTQRSVYPPGWVSPESVAHENDIQVAAYDLAHYDEIGLYVTQWFLPHTRLTLFNSRRQRPPSRYVLSSAAWRRERPVPRARALWFARGRDQVLWRLASRG